ncbi:MAG TPA: spore germination protein [Symbiobacteriaceae bacterium]|nr:spore germination protein [Symbiobacteriaceae bacterium]
MQDLGLVTEYLHRIPPEQGVPLQLEFRLARGDRQKLSLILAAQKSQLPIVPSLDQTRAALRLILGDSPDLIFRDMLLGKDGRRALLLFTDNLIKREQVMGMINVLTIKLRKENWPAQAAALTNFLTHRAAIATEVNAANSLGDVTSAILSGDSVLLVDGLTVGVRLSTRGWEHRPPEQPLTEPVVRGPKEGFTETLSVNLSLMRRRIQSESLRIETMVLGERSRTTVAILYIAGLTLPSLVDETRKRLNRIRIDAVYESGTIEELIQDSPMSLFPLMKQTERPDVVESQLLQGKVALLTDGTPHCLTFPATFAGEMQAAEDYYQHWTAGSLMRLLRYLFLLVALLGPSTYIAVTTYHQEMLPTQLLLSLMASREGLPFPAVVEALLMEISLEALREAGVRLPRPVGQSISIVGGLIIGESAVRAGLVSPVMVIVVALTAISSFIIPIYAAGFSIRILRFPMMLLAGTLGFYGMVLGLLVISVHLASLRSFGVPYMSPTMPPTAQDMQDLMIRAPWWYMRKRPQFMPLQDRQRVGENGKPGPGKGKEG